MQFACAVLIIKSTIVLSAVAGSARCLLAWGLHLMTYRSTACAWPQRLRDWLAGAADQRIIDAKLVRPVLIHDFGKLHQCGIPCGIVAATASHAHHPESIRLDVPRSCHSPPRPKLRRSARNGALDVTLAGRMAIHVFQLRSCLQACEWGQAFPYHLICNHIPIFLLTLILRLLSTRNLYSLRSTCMRCAGGSRSLHRGRDGNQRVPDKCP